MHIHINSALPRDQLVRCCQAWGLSHVKGWTPLSFLYRCSVLYQHRPMQTCNVGTHRVVAKESTSSKKMIQPGSISAALNTSASRRSLSPYHLEATASRGTYTSATEAWLAITLHTPLLLCQEPLCYRKAVSKHSQGPQCTCTARSCRNTGRLLPHLGCAPGQQQKTWQHVQPMHITIRPSALCRLAMCIKVQNGDFAQDC